VKSRKLRRTGNVTRAGYVELL